MANIANSSDAEKKEVGDTLNAAMQELIALDEKIPWALAAFEDPLESVQMSELLTALMTWPADPRHGRHYPSLHPRALP